MFTVRQQNRCLEFQRSKAEALFTPLNLMFSSPSLILLWDYDDHSPVAEVPFPASPPVSGRTSTPPGLQPGLPFLDELLDVDAEISIAQKLDIIIQKHKALFKLFKDFMKERRDCDCECKAKRNLGRNQGWENSRKGSSVTSIGGLCANVSANFVPEDVLSLIEASSKARFTFYHLL